MKKKYFWWLCIYFLLPFLTVRWLPLSASPRNKMVDAVTNGNGVNMRTLKSGKKINFGTIVESSPRLDVRDLKNQHRDDMKKLKKEYNLRSVRIVAAKDDYWYYSIQSKDRLYGVANNEGYCIIPPEYTSCFYCPSLPEETEQLQVSNLRTNTLDNFRLYHPRTEGSFLVCNSEQTSILSTTGQLLVTLPVIDCVYYHGYILSGVTSKDLFFSSENGNPLSMKAFNREGNEVVAFMTSDGKQVCYQSQIGLRIGNNDGGEQPVYSYQYDEYRVPRQGAFLLNEPYMKIPAIFGDIGYQYEDDKWLVRPNAMENVQIYSPLIHNAIKYKDVGEQMFYQGDYQGCIDYYNKVTDIDGAAQRKLFYTAASYYQDAINRYNIFAVATGAFENINDGSYTQYYEQRMNMQKWPQSDIPAWKKSLRLLDDYDKIDSLHLYSEAAENIRQQLMSNVGNYENLQSRYDQAISTLDSRIRTLKQKQMEAEAANAAIANAVFGILSNSLSGLYSGGGSPSSVVSNGKGSSKGGNSGARSSGGDSDNDSGGSGVQEKHEKCKTCGGSGTCKVCKGSGKSKASLGGNQTCDGCHGNGKCTICDGKGYKIRYESK